jgi:hypothetical protein
MNTFLTSRAFLTASALLILAAATEAREVYGVSGRRGAAVVGEDRAAVATRRGVAVSGPNGTAVARRPGPVARPLPRGYIHTVPVGYRRVAYRGYQCYYVGGVYYRAVMYEGTTVYIVVT